MLIMILYAFEFSLNDRYIGTKISFSEIDFQCPSHRKLFVGSKATFSSLENGESLWAF